MDTDEDEERLEGQFTNEMHLLELAGPVWRLVELRKDSKKSKADSKAEDQMDAAASSTQVTTDGVFTITVGGSKGSSSAKQTSSDASANAPSARMKPGLAVCKGRLYLYGGELENGAKQYTFNDFYSIDLQKLDEWKTIIKQDLELCEFMESDSEGDSSDEDCSDDDDDSDGDSDSDDSSGMDTD